MDNIVPTIKKALILGCSIIISFTFVSCDEIAKKLGYERIVTDNTQSQSNSNTGANQEMSSPTQSPTITRSFTVSARVYHFVGTAYDGIEKPTDNYVDRNIQVYSNGDIYSDGLPVRFSRTYGYDYECNRGNIIYKFNSREIDAIL